MSNIFLIFDMFHPTVSFCKPAFIHGHAFKGWPRIFKKPDHEGDPALGPGPYIRNTP